MAISGMQIPVDASTIKAVFAGEPIRQQWIYANGQQTNSPRVNDQGAQLHRTEVLADIPGIGVGGVVSLVTPGVIEEINVGDNAKLSGSAVAMISSGRDEFGVRVTLEIEKVEVAGNVFRPTSSRRDRAEAGA